MKVVHINLQNGWRGGEQQLAYLIQGLSEFECDQILVCRSGSDLERYALKNSIRYVSYKNSLFSKISSLWKFRRLLLDFDADLIHCHESKGQSLAVFSKILFSNRPKILLHRKVAFPVKGFFSKNVKYSSRFISKVICISEKVKSVFYESTRFKNISLIPDMIDVNYDYKNHNVLFNDFGINSTIKVGYIAALTYEKDHITFLNTAKQLLISGKDFHFIIIGDGPLKEQMELYSKQLLISDKVTFTGFVNQAKELLSELDYLLFTSKQEGLGSTILDSFLAKTPVITVKNGGAEDLVKQGETGFIHEVGNYKSLAESILFLEENPKEKNRIVCNAYNFVVEGFSIDKISKQTIRVYQEVLNN